ncbi:recombinase family protein [Pseudomonas sp. K5002]|uniref:recombinase family protein n=1 Tax=Pseudomonas sp. K5002 TaxID=2738828 RepID=UPI0015BA19EC|nr:recombinase family protein [Pseudomonas sp. K5002]NWD86186.1 recombinase family protein [Pseudomonas sp. K5002]
MQKKRAKSLEVELKAGLYDFQPTFAAIAKCLNAKGIRTARGKEFAPMTVKRMMERLSLTLSVTPPEQQ